MKNFYYSKCGSTSLDDLSPDVVWENVRKLAEHKGVTLKRMCLEAGIKYPTLYNFSSCNRLPGIKILYKLARWSGTGVDSLIGMGGQLVLREDETDQVEICRGNSSKFRLWQWVCSLGNEAAHLLDRLIALLKRDSRR